MIERRRITTPAHAGIAHPSDAGAELIALAPPPTRGLASGWKIDLRSHGAGDTGRIMERTETADPAIAEAAYRALLAREDLLSQPVAARLVSPVTRKAIYFSRFDRDLGAGRIHPEAPLDLFAARDMTTEASAWRPAAAAHDWEADARPYAECLKAWREQHSWTWQQTADALRVPLTTLQARAKGRSIENEQQQRRLMTLIDLAQPIVM